MESQPDMKTGRYLPLFCTAGGIFLLYIFIRWPWTFFAWLCLFCLLLYSWLSIKEMEAKSNPP